MNLSKIYKQLEGRYKNLRYFCLLFLFVILAASSGGVYFWYLKRYNEEAQKALSEGIEIYQRALRERSEKLLEEAGRAFSIGYEKYSGSSLAPFFISFEAEVSRRQGKLDNSIKLMERSLGKMSKKSPLYNMYAIKLALMKIDSKDETISEEGREALKVLAGNPKNPDRDTALYYQGLISFDSGDRVAAERVWGELTERYGDSSVWSSIAKSKLNYEA